MKADVGEYWLVDILSGVYLANTVNLSPRLLTFSLWIHLAKSEDTCSDVFHQSQATQSDFLLAANKQQRHPSLPDD